MPKLGNSACVKMSVTGYGQGWKKGNNAQAVQLASQVRVLFADCVSCRAVEPCDLTIAHHISLWHIAVVSQKRFEGDVLDEWRKTLKFP